MQYQRVQTVIWGDRRFLALPDDSRLAFLFILTHPHLTNVGAMRASVEGLAAEIGWKAERMDAALSQLKKRKMVEWAKASSFIALPKYLKHNPPANPNIAKSWAKSFEQLPECKLKRALRNRIETVLKPLPKPFLNGFETVSKHEYEYEYESEGSRTPGVVNNTQTRARISRYQSQISPSRTGSEPEPNPAKADEKPTENQTIPLANRSGPDHKPVKPHAKPPTKAPQTRTYLDRSTKARQAATIAKRKRLKAEPDSVVGTLQPIGMHGDLPVYASDLPDLAFDWCRIIKPG